MTFELGIGVDGLAARDLIGFFVGWPAPPPPNRGLAILRAADEVIVARNGSGEVIGFITALTDRVFSASIPLLEVLPDWQHVGVGSALCASMLDRLKSCYMIDLSCDDGLVPFYAALGGRRLNGMAWCNYEQLTS